jgi:hypothetical protein
MAKGNNRHGYIKKTSTNQFKSSAIIFVWAAAPRQKNQPEKHFSFTPTPNPCQSDIRPAGLLKINRRAGFFKQRPEGVSLGVYHQT